MGIELLYIKFLPDSLCRFLWVADRFASLDLAFKNKLGITCPRFQVVQDFQCHWRKGDEMNQAVFGIGFWNCPDLFVEIDISPFHQAGFSGALSQNQQHFEERLDRLGLPRKGIPQSFYLAVIKFDILPFLLPLNAFSCKVDIRGYIGVDPIPVQGKLEDSGENRLNPLPLNRSLFFQEL